MTRPAVQVKSLATERPFETYLLPVSGFPIPGEERQHVERFVGAFCDKSAARWNLSSEIFLQFEQLTAEGCRETISDRGKEWLPETGLGVWLDREPPHRWTIEEFKNMIPGDKVRPLMFQLFRVSTGKTSRLAARSTMLQFGAVLEILTSKGDAYLPAVKSLFMRGITDRSYTCFPFYVGLIEGKTMANAKSEQLSEWFSGMSVYVRESFEDQGILIASDTSLEDIFVSIGGSPTEDGWTFF